MNNDLFKVRIWNVSGGYYMPDFYLTPAGEVCEFGVFNGTPQVRKFDNQENYQKERCTGLKDMNGQLIYEGDVITNAAEWEELKEYDIRFVKWCEAYSGGLFCAVDKDGEPSDFYGGIPLLEYTRVIGNIHTWEQK